jgi:hypothetical protein
VEFNRRHRERGSAGEQRTGYLKAISGITEGKFGRSMGTIFPGKWEINLES